MPRGSDRRHGAAATHTLRQRRPDKIPPEPGPRRGYYSSRFTSSFRPTRRRDGEPGGLTGGGHVSVIHPPAAGELPNTKGLRQNRISGNGGGSTRVAVHLAL